MTSPQSPERDISKSEQTQIKEYILKHHTAMLTVMFTDIENYTVMTEQKGDAYSADLRQHHDGIMKDIIEGDEAGLIVKFIGDAVMAVFSEPTVAVEKAMEIQSRIREFNQQQSQFDDIAVRIGLHVGQIAIEDDVQLDIFGRHVNRAARVESLAAGGQVLVTYPVWDSAKGWLDRAQDIQCVSHGAYELKGIDEPIEIYEVFQPEFTQPAAPQKGKIKTKNHSMTAALIAAFFSLVVLLIAFWPKPPELWLQVNTTQPVLINGAAAQFGEVDSEGYKPLTMPLEAGDYIMTYQVSSQLAYLALFEVTGDDQRLTPSFSEVRLPSINLRTDLNDSAEPKSRPFNAIPLDGKELSGTWRLQIDSQAQGDNVRHDLSWTIETADGATMAGNATFNVAQTAGIERFDEQVIATSDGLNLVLSGFTSRTLIDATVKWTFEE